MTPPTDIPPLFPPVPYDAAGLHGSLTRLAGPAFGMGPVCAPDNLTLRTVMGVGAWVEGDLLSWNDENYLMLALLKLREIGVPVQFESYDPVNLRNGRDFLAYGTGEEKGQADLVLFNFLHNAPGYSHWVHHPKGHRYQNEVMEMQEDLKRKKDVDFDTSHYLGISPRLPYGKDLTEGAFGPAVAAVAARVVVVFGRCDGQRDVNIRHVLHPDYIEIRDIVEGWDSSLLSAGNRKIHADICTAHAMIHKDYARALGDFYRTQDRHAMIVPLIFAALDKSEGGRAASTLRHGGVDFSS